MKTGVVKVLFRLAEIALGGVFIVSGVGKMTNAAGFGELISSYGLEWFSILAPFITLAELALGCCLILRIAIRQSLAAIIAMLVIFTIAFLYANLWHGIEDCGCFGGLEAQMPVWATYLRNIILLLVACLLWKFTPQDICSVSLRWRLVLLGVLMSVALFWTGNTWQPSTFYVNKFNTRHRLLGLEVSQTPLAKYLQASPDSTYLVWVYSYHCGSCLNGIENIKCYQQGVADRFVPLVVSKDSDGSRRKLLNVNFSTTYVGEELAGFIYMLPTLLYLEDGRIRHVIEGSVPSVYTFKTLYLGMTDEELLNSTTLKK